MDKKLNTKDIGTLKYTDLFPLGKKDSEEVTRAFLHEVFEILMDFVTKSNDRSAKILDFHQPNQLKEILDLDIPDEPLNLDQLLVDCKDTLKYQIKTGHPHFFNQLSSGLDVVGMAGEWLTATANTNMFTYEIAAVFILMEQVTLKKMREIIGWSNGDSILGPGGSISNLYACLCARHKMYPTYKQKGLMGLGQLVIYTSEHSHYSMKGAGMVMGFGTDHVIEVKTDARGRMIPEELEKCILADKAKGYKPFFVCCTAGTTVFGAFDPIEPCADICKKYGLWLHVDAAWGGGVLLSRKHRTKMNGVERADSVTWNPHKLMGSPLQCSTVHFREDGLLMSCNQLSADYLFQQDKHYDVNFDTGDKVIQCGRHNDIFKLWLMWRSKGDKGYERHIDHLFEMTEYMLKKLREKKDRFHLILEEPECTNVSFWYIPKRLRNVPHTPEKEKILGELTAKLKGRMMNAGTLMIGYQPQGDIPNFFRSIISNAAVQEYDVDFMLDELDRLGHDL
ncbi:glutamate decarboxylase [Nephila pilipes]|uniref:Glutamate decarboxylase n=1 Tax=Nephila pilipes TaxID=299642 RepID=A0A8X6NCN1_NEPPI|nr:glutamate decarboxylase [Nephila pilipes]